MAEHTFLFADLAGFSALTEAHGDEDAADLVADFCDCVRDLLGEYDANEIKTIGDEVLLTEATYGGAGDVPGVELSRHGEHRFKNVRDPVRLYRAARAGRGDHGRLIDPVCRMAVDPDRAAGTLADDGATYFFCSLECARAFSEAPGSYVA